MSLTQTISNFKDDALNVIVCPIVLRLGIQTIPAASLLVGEVTLSYFLHYGVILPSPIGIELMEFPAKMVYILQCKKRIKDALRVRISLGRPTKRPLSV
jgi:hypothetical protein